MTELKQIFGPLMIENLMANIHLKLYNFAATEREIDDRSNYRRSFRYMYIKKYKTKVASYKAKIKQ
jgi:hypothetical protein